MTTFDSPNRFVALVCALRKSDASWLVAESTRRLSTVLNQAEEAIAKTMPIITMVMSTSGRVKPRSSLRTCRVAARNISIPLLSAHLPKDFRVDKPVVGYARIMPDLYVQASRPDHFVRAALLLERRRN